MLPTPSTSHIDVDAVYEPAEDSFLLLDTLSSPSEIEFLHHRFAPDVRGPSHHGTPPSRCTPPLLSEIGTGSGVVLAFVTANAETLFGTRDILTLGTDLNGLACQATRETVERACRKDPTPGEQSTGTVSSETSATLLATLTTDLGTPLRDNQVDVLIFNPPYVPSSSVPHPPSPPTASSTPGSLFSKTLSFEEKSHLLALSYEGGNNGMEVTDVLLQRLPALLNQERGLAYILLCAQNKPAEIIERVRAWGEMWKVDIVGRSGLQGGWERLVVIRIAREL